MKVKHFTENTVGIDYVCGDVHGCFSLLQKTLDEIGFDESKDRLFSVGDLVDRGPASEECLEWLSKPWFHAVRGNHEQMAIDYFNGIGDSDIYAYNGGSWFLNLDKSTRQLYIDAFSALPYAIDIKVGNKLYGIIHAECPTKSWSDVESVLNGDYTDSAENLAMWSRDKISYKDKTFIDDVELLYVGHTPLREVTVLGNVIYIDTGAVFNKTNLTILEIY
jgi:serine/threonine protein phosphatase 1